MPPQSANLSQILELVHWPKGGVNQSTRRSVIEDEELWWLENYFPIATGELRSAWGPSAPIYTATPPNVIRRIFFTNMNGQDPFGYMFLDDGTGLGLVDQVNLNTGEVTPLGQIWQPVAPHYWADLKLWKPGPPGNPPPAQRGGLLIGSPQGYYAWDNSLVSFPGDLAPDWLTNSSPNNLVMPSGLPGIYAMEVYNQRMWVMGQRTIAFSAPSNGADFSASGGGGAFADFGDQLTVSYTDLQQTAGFLYIFGDSKTDWISNIQLVGSAQATTTPPSITSPFTTEFQLSNYNPQIGQRFFRSVGKWLQALTVFDGAGIYLITGDGQATWISQKITNLWRSLDPTPFEPTAAPCHIFGQRWMLYNGTFTDPWGVSRSMLLCWNGQIWTVASQRYRLTHIGYYEENSCISAYGTDGRVLVRLFAQPDPALPKLLSTKSYNGVPSAPLDLKNWQRVYVQIHNNLTTPEGAFLTGSLTTEYGGVPNGSQDVSFEVKPGQDDIRPYPTNGQGINAYLDLSGNSPDYTIERIMLAYEARTRFGA